MNCPTGGKYKDKQALTCTQLSGLVDVLEKKQGRVGLCEVFGVACVCVGYGEHQGRRLCGGLGVGVVLIDGGWVELGCSCGRVNGHTLDAFGLWFA